MPFDPLHQAWDRVTIITVTHNAGLVIGDFLDSIPNYAELVVVDNASTDDTLQIIERNRPQTNILKNDVGLGYGSGANCGLRAASREFALLANPDSLLSDCAIEKLVATADLYPEAVMFGPCHLNQDGSIEVSYDVALWDRSLHDYKAPSVFPEGPICADFLSGAVNMVRLETLRKVGFYDPEIFLYYEDDDMCLRLRRAGASLIFVPDAKIVHIGGGSVRPNRSYYWEKFWHIAWSRSYIEQKYKGRRAAIFLIFKNIPKLLFKIIIYSLSGKRQKSWRDLAKLAGYIGFLWGKRASKLPPNQT